MSDGTWVDESDWEIGEDADADDGVDSRHRRRWWQWSVGRTWGSPRSSTESSGRREAVVQDVPGVTRDRVSYDALWTRATVRRAGHRGLGARRKRAAAVGRRTSRGGDAHRGCDHPCGRCGGRGHAFDEAAARTLRRSGKPVFLAANKVDTERGESDAAALWSLGLGQPYAISAMHGRGVADLLDDVVAALPAVSESTAAAADRAEWRWWASRTSARARC